MIRDCSYFQNLFRKVAERLIETDEEVRSKADSIPSQETVVFVPFNCDGTIMSVGKQVVVKHQYVPISTYSQDFVESLPHVPIKTYRNDFVNTLKNFGNDFLSQTLTNIVQPVSDSPVPPVDDDSKND